MRKIYNLQFTIYKSFCVALLFFILNFTFYIPVFAATPTLSLSPASKTINKSCSFTVDVLINTGGSDTDGADAILIYDSTRFKAERIRNGTVYGEYPGNSIDAQSGKITVSGLASVSSPFKGSGTLASLDFTVLADAPDGATQINFDFDQLDKGKTSDSNIAERGTVTDILGDVGNGTYTIGIGSCSSSNTNGSGNVATGSAKPTRAPGGGPDAGDPIPTKKPVLDPAGVSEPTLIVLGLGGLFTVFGLLGLKGVKR